jgi:hypothetical protein
MTPESKLKADCRKSAINHGCKLYSLSIKGYRGCPDHLLTCPEQAFVFVEFKTPRGRLSEHQASTIISLRMMGAEVWVVTTVKQFEELLGDVLERPIRFS